MYKKIFLISFVFLSVFLLSGCGKEDSNKKAIEFKNDYESLNGKTNANGKEHRSVTISEDNVFIEITEEELLKKIENKESFYIYFGSTLCPWCRSVIEKADFVSRGNGVDAVYYLDIWDDEGKEIFRDKYVLNSNNVPELEIEGSKVYKKILELSESLLDDYTLTDSNGNKIQVGEKRVYAPNFIYFLAGKPIRMVTGISSLQKDSREELTDEMLNEEEKIFDEFFSNSCNPNNGC